MSVDWTPQQRAAISARGRTLVAAAAGSGKTSVLTELVVQMLVGGEVAPADICAVTFTDKAAQEMRGRVAAKLAALGQQDLLAQLELARIGTIHSLCAQVLRSHGVSVGAAPETGVLDDAQASFVRSEALRAAFEQLDGDGDVHWVRARMGDERIETMLVGILDLAAAGDGTARLVTPDEVQAPQDPRKPDVLLVAPDECRRATATIERLWQAFDAEVQGSKHALGRFSYDDLERLAVEAVRIPDVRTALRARWTVVLVDEFQDTNERQYELLDAIGGEHMFMVGDEWQSIYRFRGADIEVFRSRRGEVAGGALPMRENFRSDAPVLDVVNRVFGRPEVFEDYEPVEVGSDTQRERPAPAVELLVVPASGDEASTEDVDVASEHEARRVAERIAELVESGAATPGEIAVLAGTKTHAAVYEDAIRAWGIPVLRTASDGYYDQRDVRDALAILALVRNRADDFAALSVLAGPVGDLSWEELDDIALAAREAKVPMLAAAAGAGSPGAARVASELDRLEGIAATGSLVQLAAAVVELPELELGAASQVDGAVRVANLRRLVDLAASAAQIDVRDVATFLEFVDAQRRGAQVGEASIADESLGAVRLMTVHASKGLEFPYVFAVEAAAPVRGPSDLVPEPHVDERGTVHVPLPGTDGRCKRTPELQRLADLDKAAVAEEKRRLWYVAMTRAKRRLVVSGRYDFEPKKDGDPRAVGGSLKWLASAFEVEAPFGGPGHVSQVMDELVVLDTRTASRVPEHVWQLPAASTDLARPLDLPRAIEAPVPTTAAVADEPFALRELLRDAVGTGSADEWRQLDGTRLHDAVARLVDAARAGVPRDALLDPTEGPWLTDRVRARLAPVVESPVFARLVELGGRSEVPYVVGTGAVVESRVAPGVEVATAASDVGTGRFDALARLEDGSWWIVDWKSTLPPGDDRAWDAHAAQLARYAATALRGGAGSAYVTLVSLAQPDRAPTWRIEGGTPRSGARPSAVSLP